MKYMIEYAAGRSAALAAEGATSNPYAWHTPSWWAWSSGWAAGRAEMADHFASLLAELNDPNIISRGRKP